jgi:hypothetical protein
VGGDDSSSNSTGDDSRVTHFGSYFQWKRLVRMDKANGKFSSERLKLL